MVLMKRITKRIYLYGEMVMFSHTLFSLPFALITMFIAANGLPEIKIIIYGLIALVGARTGANAFNRYADRLIDAKNPRTESRHISSGQIKSMESILVTILSYLVYFYAASQINEICFYLSPIPILFFTIYPYTKRFTSYCHLFLGIACAFAVLGAWMAVTNELFFITFNSKTIPIAFVDINIIPIILFVAVALWNAGFDTIYGTQDITFDRENKIYSIPAKFGLEKALLIAKIFHLLMILLLLSLVFVVPQLSLIYLIGIFISSILLLFEHKIVNPHNSILMKLASYKLNQLISISIFTFTCLDIFLF
ncbi:putative 4-hydroxybenzoate polyprenyltransferase [Mycoplasmatota bacterium]|nr:putative 4-hydroxybenzoate polyprenyltransferase [Mycoplasmatota bacterium]